MHEHSGTLGAIAQRWFGVMRGCGDDVRELLHDGQPTACVGDAAFAYVNAFKAHVNVGFFRGAEIADPEGLLEGSGKFMRHVKLRPDLDVDPTALRKLIETAYTDMVERLMTGQVVYSPLNKALKPAVFPPLSAAEKESSMAANKSSACSIAPWLSVRNGAHAVEFYKSALGAREVYRVEDPGGAVVSRLSVDGAEFWLSDETPEHANFSPESLGGGSVKMLLTVNDPDKVFARAIAAGAREVYPVHDEHGWRVGRLVDPYGHHWEIGRPLEETAKA
jgi:PhnB protein